MILDVQAGGSDHATLLLIDLELFFERRLKDQSTKGKTVQKTSGHKWKTSVEKPEVQQQRHLDEKYNRK